MIEPTAVRYINNQLRSRYGIDTDTNRPMFRIVWSDDQTEKRLSKFTATGIELLHKEIVEFQKYKVIGVHERWILEQLVIVPEFQQEELGIKVSYEPLWVFQDKNGNPLPPRLDMCLFIVNTLYAAKGKKSLRNYVEEEQALNSPEATEARINKLQEELFGNETDTGDALAHRQGVSLTGPKFKENQQ